MSRAACCRRPVSFPHANRGASASLANCDSSQIRAARGLLDISQAELAKGASLHVASVRRLEAATEMRGAVETLWKIQKALEAAGIEFIPAEEGKGPGVRLKVAPRRTPKRTVKRPSPMSRSNYKTNPIDAVRHWPNDGAIFPRNVH